MSAAEQQLVPKTVADSGMHHEKLVCQSFQTLWSQLIGVRDEHA